MGRAQNSLRRNLVFCCLHNLAGFPLVFADSDSELVCSDNHCGYQGLPTSMIFVIVLKYVADGEESTCLSEFHK